MPPPSSKNNNRNLIIGIASALVIVVAVAVIVIINSNDNKLQKDQGVNKSNPDGTEVKAKTYTEEDLIQAYGMSIKQAEQLVMEFYHSDNFECSTKINGMHYEVTVTDILSGEKSVFDVNPASNEYTKIK